MKIVKSSFISIKTQKYIHFSTTVQPIFFKQYGDLLTAYDDDDGYVSLSMHASRSLLDMQNYGIGRRRQEEKRDSEESNRWMTSGAGSRSWIRLLEKLGIQESLSAYQKLTFKSVINKQIDIAYHQKRDKLLSRLINDVAR